MKKLAYFVVPLGSAYGNRTRMSCVRGMYWVHLFVKRSAKVGTFFQTTKSFDEKLCLKCCFL